MPTTVLTIAGVEYDRLGRPAARVRPDTLELNLDGGHDSFSFSEIGGPPMNSWADGDTVEVTWIRDDLSERLIFAGTIADVSHTPTPEGWVIGYQALSAGHRCDHVPVAGYDRTGVMAFNRSPEDPWYTESEAGLTLGDILGLVLSVAETAAALAASGIAYADLDPVTLHAATLADLALLDVVPASQVTFQGEGVLAQVGQALQHWMPRFALRVTAGGVIRLLDTRDVGASGAFVPVTVTLPNATTGGDPISWPAWRRSTARCATRVKIRGSADVEAAVLSTADDTLAEVWTSTEEGDWTYSDFTQPKDAWSEGSVSSMTGNSAVVDPSDASRAWGSNFWSNRKATLFLFAPLASGLEMTLSRPVTTNTACTAGGTATITWDASWPADSTGYTKYKLVGGAGGQAEVGRLYTVKEPATGAVGMDTEIGAHLVRRHPLPIKVANSSGGWIQVHYPFGIVCREDPDDPPGMELPINVETIPRLGQFRFYQPVVSVYGDPADLELGYPTTKEGGLPGDVRVVAMYSRGTLEAVVPANSGTEGDIPEYEGTAYASDGVTITKIIDLPGWTNRGDLPRLLELARNHLDVLKDVVHEGQFDYYGEPPWDWWDFATAINFSVPPHAGSWEDMDAPVRSVRLSWPQGEGVIHKFSIGFSNRRRPHSGDDMYLPAAFTYQGLDTSRAFDTSQSFSGGMGDVGVEGGMGLLGGAGQAGMAGMLGGAAAGMAGMVGGANAGIGAMNAGAQQGIAGANAGAASGISNALNMTPGGPQQVDMNAIGGAAGMVDATMNQAAGMVQGGLDAARGAVEGSPKIREGRDGRDGFDGRGENPRRDAIRANQEQAQGRVADADRAHTEMASGMANPGADPADFLPPGGPKPLRPHVSDASPLQPHVSDAKPLQPHVSDSQPLRPHESDAKPLRPREPTEGESEASGRGREERRRLHPEDE